MKKKLGHQGNKGVAQDDKEFTTQEIADVLGISQQAVAAIERKALKKFRARMRGLGALEERAREICG